MFHKLKNVIGCVDGCHIPFWEKPWGIPEGKDAKDFLNRKGIYSINTQIMGGFDRRIYDILLTAPGSFHDAAVWSMSQGKAWLETRFPQRFFRTLTLRIIPGIIKTFESKFHQLNQSAMCIFCCYKANSFKNQLIK